MLRYLPSDSVLRQPAKKCKTDEAKSKEYETEKRVRTFQKTWLTNYPWLTYDGGNMFCTTCKRADPDGQGTLITGSSNFKVESLKAHEQSSSHISHTLAANAKSAKPGSSNSGKSLRALNKANFNRIAKLFINAHGLGKQGMPYSGFRFLCQLDERKGIEIGKTYINDKAAQQFLFYIAETERLRIAEEIGKSSFLSVISDGATDSAHMEAEIVFVRACHKGMLKIYFAGLRNVGKANADNISATTAACLTDNFGDSWENKIVGMATDGASVVLGRKGVLFRRSKRYDSS